jgi:AraC-like DNA-binding protein/ligand-binding sensor protein
VSIEQSDKLHTRVNTVLELCGRYLPQGAAFIPIASVEEVICGPRFCSFCRGCLDSPLSGQYCRQATVSSAYQALQTGEPYYYRCWLGLNTVVVPVAPRGRLIGAIEMGGFHFPDSREQNEAFIRSNLNNVDAALAASAASSLEDVLNLEPRDVRGAAGFIFDSLFSSGVNAGRDFRENREKYLQQRRIAELMQSYGGQTISHDDIFTLFPALLLALRQHDRDRVMLLMDDFFSRILLETRLNADQIKVHVHLLLSVLTREAVVTRDFPLEDAITRHFQTYRQLEPLADTEDICYWAFKQVDAFMDRMKAPTPETNSLADRVLEWIEQNFWKKVTLGMAARSVNASASSIVKTLRARTGRSFREHVISSRLKESRHLLAQTDVPLSGISARCGFYDQSHFCRTFKVEFGQSPGEFRRQARLAPPV